MSDPDTLGAAVAGLGVFGPLVAWIVRRLIRAVERIPSRLDAIEEKVDSVRERVKRIEPIAERVEAEFRPNGGSSMKDALTMLARRQAILAGQIRARFEGDTLPTYECDEQGNCTYASAPLAELFGIPAAEFLGNGWLRAIGSAAERAAVWDRWQYAVRHDIPYEDLYTIRPHGRPAQKVRTYTRAVRDNNGKILCYFGVVVPVKPDSDLVGGGTPTVPARPAEPTVPPPPPDEPTDPKG